MPKPPSASRPALRPRVYLSAGVAVGPGKVDLLRAVGAERSISAAARTLGMSYSRAWQLVDAMNAHFGGVVETSRGGRGGGGAALTATGVALIAAYEALERRLNASAECELAALAALLPRRRR